jgi:hypothetical protein
MSKDKMKNLLNEGTIRRFMKLAEIETLSDDFVDTLTTEEVQDTEEPIEEVYHAGRDDEELEEEVVDEAHCGARDDDEPMEEMAHPAKADDEADEPMMDEPAELDMDEPAAEGTDLAADLARGMAAVIEDVLGVSVAVEDGEADAEPAELDMDDMEEPGLPEPEDDEPLDMPMMEEAELDLEALTREVTERVTARLQKEGRQEKVAEDLAERIIQRLKNQ